MMMVQHCVGHTEVPLSGGVSRHCFPVLKEWFEGDADHMRALEYVAARKNMSRYRSVMDFLLCEVLEEYRPSCFRFYDDGCLRYSDLTTEDQRLSDEAILLRAAIYAYVCFCEDRKRSWTAFRSDVIEMVEG